MAEKWFMTPFRHMLHDHHLWGIRRKTVVPAFSLGVALAFLPFPGHFFVAAIAALMLRVNIPVAALTTLISNPLTMGPIFYFSYRLGAALLGLDPEPFEIEMSLDWVQNVFVYIWLPLMLGCILAGSVASLVAYVVLDAIWRYSIHDYKSRKRGSRRQDS
jgi:uncharacterized protein (DUF2062 family)